MTLLTGLTEDGLEVPVQVKPDGRLVAEGLMGTEGPAGPVGPAGPAGPASFPLGTAVLPGLPPVGDPNTGIFSPGADELALSTGGTEKARITSDGKVGIGTSTPQQALSVLGAVQRNISNINDEEAGFIGKYEAQGGSTAGMYFDNTLSGNFATWLLFKTTDPWNNLRTAVTIDASQRVGIGTSTPAATLTVEGDVNISTTPVYADNAAAIADGLVAGDIYRRADGTLMIAF